MGMSLTNRRARKRTMMCRTALKQTIPNFRARKNHTESDGTEKNQGILYENVYSIWALLMPTGSKRLTCEEYDSVRLLLRSFIPLISPHVLSYYSSLFCRLRPQMLLNLVVNFPLLHLPVALDMHGAKKNLEDAGGIPLSNSEYVLLSSML